ncbi:MAG: MoaD/ThiS family protein [Synergistaceae bacterium]|jgi:adenylyltransferase/sulfurtransferase|nr:MoaD/ThiS family protein [Synergistaceae bacterium]
MPVSILIPTALRAFTDRRSEITANGSTVGEAIRDFASAYPDIKPHLFEDGGELRSFINIYLGEKNIKSMDGLETPVSDGETIMLVPAIAGGAGGAA